ncbi:hypothetical protein RRG08_035870 [Elysia crispata]|uniref:Uncharacterized protein n=1 Tax=Elysia crispata TaxID=231223 RepID=A0AAE1B0E6_9GAST|nr:hypothetical protein RRG08_035870 [Elysia crispata]
MEPDRIPRQLLYGDLSEGKRQQDTSQKRYKNNVKANLAHDGVPSKQLEACAQNRVRIVFSSAVVSRDGRYQPTQTNGGVKVAKLGLDRADIQQVRGRAW